MSLFIGVANNTFHLAQLGSEKRVCLESDSTSETCSRAGRYARYEHQSPQILLRNTHQHSITSPPVTHSTKSSLVFHTRTVPDHAERASQLGTTGRAWKYVSSLSRLSPDWHTLICCAPSPLTQSKMTFPKIEARFSMFIHHVSPFIRVK